MSFDDPRLFDDPSLVPLDRADRGVLARLLSLVLEADRPRFGGRPIEKGRTELARWLYHQRRQRARHLPAELFGEPAWDILLVLYWSRHSQRRLTISAVCDASGAPSTTALRYIEHLHRTGYIIKIPHPTDKRVSWLSLSDNGDQRMARYLDGILSEGQTPDGCASAD